MVFVVLLSFVNDTNIHGRTTAIYYTLLNYTLLYYTRSPVGYHLVAKWLPNGNQAKTDSDNRYFD